MRWRPREAGGLHGCCVFLSWLPAGGVSCSVGWESSSFLSFKAEFLSLKKSDTYTTCREQVTLRAAALRRFPPHARGPPPEPQ